MKGTVEFFDEDKGIGFIKPDIGENDLFVQRGSLMTFNHSLHEAQRVEFDVISGERGLEAINVKEA